MWLLWARALAKLEKEGFITRVRDDEDKRSNKIYLSDKAINIKNDILSVLNDWNNVIIENLTKEEEEQLIYLLGKISDNITI